MKPADVPDRFEVTAKDLLTGLSSTYSISYNENIKTQEAAEVYFLTCPTGFGGKHPGFEITPKDKGKFDKALNNWSVANPNAAKELAERPDMDPTTAKAMLDSLAAAEKAKAEAPK